MALALRFVLSKNVKIKFQIEYGPHIEELATGNSKDFHLILVYLLPQEIL